MTTKSQGRRGQTAAVELDPVAMFTLIVPNVENGHHDFQSVACMEQWSNNSTLLRLKPEAKRARPN